MAQAKKIGLKGRVRNLPSGDVYIVVFGEKQHIDALVKWCYEGSQLSRVHEVLIEDIDFELVEGFEIAY